MAEVSTTGVGQLKHLGWATPLPRTSHRHDFRVTIGHDVIQMTADACGGEAEFLSDISGTNRAVAKYMEHNSVPRIVIAHWVTPRFSTVSSRR